MLSDDDDDLLPTKTAALTVPILPHTSPQAEQPKGLCIKLFPHQLRALHRCLLIETDGSLSNDFGDTYGYKSKGGVLADAVGTGKTATSIGLVLSGHVENGGDTLVVAPSHLIPQWKLEIDKFCKESAMEVLVGKQEYEAHGTLPPSNGRRRIVLVDVDTILNESKLWYNFRRVFTEKGGPQIRKISRERMERYRQAALACVKSPRGPCSYDGWVYTGSLHLPCRPWRRVIFDEIQDLVAEGTESQKNLLQLSHQAPHVWLLSATPFPHGNRSVYANHELLGFCRMRLDVEVSHKLHKEHTFEKIKRKLYIQSPRHVADEAVVATKSVVHKTEYIPQMGVEKSFYEMELKRIEQEYGTTTEHSEFGHVYSSLREMTVHPEASAELREQALGDAVNGRSKERVGQFRSVNSFANVSLNRAKQRRGELYQAINRAKKELFATQQSLKLATEIKTLRDKPVAKSVFAKPTSIAIVEKAEAEAKLIHSFFCTCPKLGGVRCRADKQVSIRTTTSEDYSGPEFIFNGYQSTKKVIKFFNSYCHPEKKTYRGHNATVGALENYLTFTTVSISSRKEALLELEKELDLVKTRIEMLPGTTTGTNTKSPEEHDLLASTHGSKPAALVRYLRGVMEQGEQAIVFSYWHDTLKLVQRTLKKCNLPSVFCDGSGSQMSKALTDFTSGEKSILLLSAQAKASGANLQCATHVVLLDPAGSSAQHGAALEQQAVGRAVRMGQDKPVTVVRFCVVGTLESSLFVQIDEAATSARERASDSSYVIEGADKALPKKSERVAEPSDVQVTESLSAKERLERQFGKAKETGMIIELLDSDDDDESMVTARVEVESTPVPNGRVVVKTEKGTTAASEPVRDKESPVKDSPISPSTSAKDGGVSTNKRTATDSCEPSSSKHLRVDNTTDAPKTPSCHKEDTPALSKLNDTSCAVTPEQDKQIAIPTTSPAAVSDGAEERMEEQGPGLTLAKVTVDDNGEEPKPSFPDENAAATNTNDAATDATTTIAGEAAAAPIVAAEVEKPVLSRSATALSPNKVNGKHAGGGGLTDDNKCRRCEDGPTYKKGNDVSGAKSSYCNGPGCAPPLPPSSKDKSSSPVLVSQSSLEEVEETDMEPSTDSVSSTAGMLQVKQLLDRCELSSYGQQFQENGYDSLEWLYTAADDAAIMEKIATSVGFTVGHALRFQNMLSKEAKEQVRFMTV